VSARSSIVRSECRTTQPAREALYDRLTDRGTHHVVATPSTPKRLCIAYGCWSKGEAFDSTYEKRIKEQKPDREETSNESDQIRRPLDLNAPISRTEEQSEKGRPPCHKRALPLNLVVTAPPGLLLTHRTSRSLILHCGSVIEKERTCCRGRILRLLFRPKPKLFRLERDIQKWNVNGRNLRTRKRRLDANAGYADVPLPLPKLNSFVIGRLVRHAAQCTNGRSERCGRDPCDDATGQRSILFSPNRRTEPKSQTANQQLPNDSRPIDRASFCVNPLHGPHGGSSSDERRSYETNPYTPEWATIVIRTNLILESSVLVYGAFQEQRTEWNPDDGPDDTTSECLAEPGWTLLEREFSSVRAMHPSFHVGTRRGCFMNPSFPPPSSSGIKSPVLRKNRLQSKGPPCPIDDWSI